MTVPEPLTGDLFERCRIALTHTLDGLAELDRQREREQEEEIRRRKQRVRLKLKNLNAQIICQIKYFAGQKTWLKGRLPD